MVAWVQLDGPEGVQDDADVREQRFMRSRSQETDSCVLCGRPVGRKGVTFVHMVDGGSTLAPVAEVYENEAADLGWWPVGSTCAKRVPVEFRSKHWPARGGA